MNQSISAVVDTKRPVSVLIQKSESREFGSNQTMPFSEFERTAIRVAFSQAGRGYCKTWVVVTFDNGDTHQCRLDLGPRCDLNFQDHAQGMVTWSKTEKGQEYIATHKEQALFAHIAAMQFDDAGNLPALREALNQADAEASAAMDKEQEEQTRRDEETAQRQLAADIADLQAEPSFGYLKQHNGQGRIKEALANIRLSLKKHFPAVKFSVRASGRLDMASIIWTDGPTEEQVKNVTHRYETCAAWRWVFGKLGSLHLSRDISDALRAEALSRFNEKNKTQYVLVDTRNHQAWFGGFSVCCGVYTIANQLSQTPTGWDLIAD